MRSESSLKHWNETPLPCDGDEEGCQCLQLVGRELGGGGKAQAAGQQAVHHVEVAEQLTEDGSMAGEEGQDGAAEVAAQGRIQLRL